MGKIRKIFREPMTSVLFILGLAISCFILINVAGLVEKINAENKVLKNYNYTAKGFIDRQPALEKYGTELTAKNGLKPGDEEYKEEYEKKERELMDTIIEALIQESEANTYLEMLVRVNDMIDEYSAYIVMAVNEDINIKCTRDYNINTENGIIIGESLLEYTKETNGVRTLIIGGITMKVIGVMENHMSGGVDNSLYLFWNNCDEEVKEYLVQSMYNMGNMLEYHFKSDSDISDVYDEFVSRMEKEDIENMMLGAEYEGDYRNHCYRFFNSAFMGASLIFSIFNCFSVAYLWIAGRKSELAVRMAYGYNTGQIMGMVFKDIIKLCVPASILAIIAQIIYTMALGDNIFDGMLIMRILLVCIGMLGIAVLTSVYILKKIRKMSTVDILSEN